MQKYFPSGKKVQTFALALSSKIVMRTSGNVCRLIVVAVVDTVLVAGIVLEAAVVISVVVSLADFVFLLSTTGVDDE